MQCPVCGATARRFGCDRHGHQRYQCPACPRTFLDPDELREDRRRLPPDRAAFCLRMILEGVSVRSTERLTGTHRDTILATMVAAGERCQHFLETAVRGVAVLDVQADEVWGFVGCKEKTRERRDYPDDMGDAYCFTALERASKFIITWHLGKRCPADTYAFAQKLRDATNGRFQLTTDGFRPYLTAILGTLGGRVDFATLVKVYGESEDERRYSPPRVLQVVPTIRAGAPDPARICTSHVERSNLSVRMSIRRMTRLTNAFSKKWSNHEAALALFFGYYNFVRVHMTLRTTPAVAIGLTDRPWTVAELLRRVVI